MSKENTGGVSVYISPDIVEALNARQKAAEETGVKVGLDPLCLVKPSIGWMVRTYLRHSLGMNNVNGVE